MTNKDLAELVFPNINKTIENYNNLYPKRDLKEGARVTRYAPSPTGFIHIGALLASFTANVIAKETDGVCYLRIEDTDTKRTVDNGIMNIINGLKEYGVTFDEGPISETESIGNYGPYIQSERKEIYHAFIKELLLKDRAYVCFCTPDDLDNIRKEQESKKDRIGYYGKYAKCRNLSIDEVINRIKNGEDYIIRFKSLGNFDNKITCKDEIKGELTFPENDIDAVIMKSDGLPTYHFAHIVDDYLMHTTHVTRGDEWLSSLPLHYDLFKAFGFKIPKYAHIAPLAKIDSETGGMRKLSKRKDPEASMSYYHELGIPYEAVRLYLATILNSSFEEWYLCNQDKDVDDFKFEFKKMSKSPALFDLEKLNNISKNYISKLKASKLYEDACIYLNQYDKEFYNIFTKDKDYSISILNIEREQKKPRKDIGAYSDIKNNTWYMYDELFNNFEYEWVNIANIDEIKLIVNTYFKEYYDINDDKETWFNKVKELCDRLGYASDMKRYKEDPSKYKGNVADVSTVIRVFVTSKKETPDLYEILRILGTERINNRINLL